MLARYCDSDGRLREVLAEPGSGGSVLVIDRDAATRGDGRLVAHLAADEPRVNAAVACSDYLMSPSRNRRCRRLTPEDLLVAPFGGEGHHRDPSGRGTGGVRGAGEARVSDGVCIPGEVRGAGEVRDAEGNVYRLQPRVEGIAVPDLRWHRLALRRRQGGARPVGMCEARPVSLREVVGGLQSYQPMRTLTARALVEHLEDARVSIATLRHELERLERSPIVLNRGLREAVLAAVETQAISFSEITIRCGRCKHDARGNIQGDTSWLTRRIGLRPEAGRRVPTPWVHSDVLALIAREGLGVSPHEVELT